MHYPKICIGNKYGKLTVLEFLGRKCGDSFWKCQCDCGNTSNVLGGNLKTGNSKTCGCEGGNWKHGLCDQPIYSTWKGMIARCYGTSSGEYWRYGGRGIRVCEFLRTSPANILLIIGEKPIGNFSIDRENNEGHYSCGQCAECLRCGYPKNIRWATPVQQSRNTRRAVFLERNGSRKLLVEWSVELGINRGTMRARLRRGQDPFTGVRNKELC